MSLIIDGYNLMHAAGIVGRGSGAGASNARGWRVPELRRRVARAGHAGHGDGRVRRPAGPARLAARAIASGDHGPLRRRVRKRDELIEQLIRPRSRPAPPGRGVERSSLAPRPRHARPRPSIATSGMGAKPVPRTTASPDQAQGLNRRRRSRTARWNTGWPNSMTSRRETPPTARRTDRGEDAGEKTLGPGERSFPRDIYDSIDKKELE